MKTVLGLVSAGKEMKVVDDQHGCPSFADDLAGMICRLVVARRPGLFHVTNQGATTWYRFAVDIAAAAGLDPSLVTPITTAELRAGPSRPPSGQLGPRQRRPPPVGHSPSSTTTTSPSSAW